MPDAHKNFAYSTVLTPPSPGVSGTSLVVAAGDGAKFPTPPFNVTIWPIGVIPLTTNAEIARCTAISTDTLTLARAQEGSSARTVIAGDQVAATITAKTLTDVETMLIYGGDYAAGNYVDGQIVVYNGIAYLCTSPTNVAPAAWPGGISPPAAPFTIPYGTSLPASPTDGQLAILVDSVTNPTYQWKFRYNLGSTSAYKWEFVGGTSASSNVDAAESTASAGWTDLTTVGPQFTLPRSGDYLISISAEMANSATGNGMYVALSNAPASPLWNLSPVSMQSGAYYQRASRTVRTNGLTSGAVVKLQYLSTGGTSTFRLRDLQVQPVRVA